MDPAIIGLLVVLGVAVIGVFHAARSGMLKAAIRRPPLPPLDVGHPLVIELSTELRALDALPISTKSEREHWEEARQLFDKKLRTIWGSVYDSLPHELEHYLSDADIRARDPGYARQQRMQLSALLGLSPEEPNNSPETNALPSR